MKGNSMYAVIMAGGKGARFWPRSRNRLPKHLLDIVSEQTIIQETVARMAPLVSPENILIVTGASHAEELMAQLPRIPRANILIEPVGRNTAPCIGLAAVAIRKAAGDGMMISDLRDLSRQRESLVDDMTALKMEIKRLLNITFPELEHMTGIFTKAILKLLLRYPSAHSLKGVDLGHLTQMLIADSQGRKRDAFAEDLLKAAQSSIATDSPAKDMILRQNIMLLLYLEDALEEITDMLIEMSRNLMEEDINILTSIKGIGDKAAATFLIEMGGSINQFERSGKIIAMAGLDPSVYQSGKHEGKGKITKRGNRHLRKIIWLMTTKVIQYTDIFNVYYLKRRKEGLPYKMAVLATAHKLIRVVYAMLTQRTTFSLQVNS
jgi:transposase